MEKFWKWMHKKGHVRLNKYTKDYVFNGVMTNKSIKNQMLIGYMLEYINHEEKVYDINTHVSIEENYIRLVDFIKRMYK